MSTSTTSSPFERFFQDTVRTLCARWYALPSGSLRPYFDTLRRTLSDHLGEVAALQQFVTLTLALPGIQAQLDGKLLADLKKVTATPLSEEVQANLQALCLAEDPTQLAFAQVGYRSNQREGVLLSVRKKLSEAQQRGLLSAEVQAQLALLWQPIDDRAVQRPDYNTKQTILEEVLREIERNASLLRLVWRELLAGKEISGQGQAPDVIYRGAEPSSEPISKGVVQRSEVPSALESMSTPFESAPAEPIVAKLLTDIRFPKRVKANEEVPLTVRLTLQAQAESIASNQVNVPFADANQPELVDVRLSAPGFYERFDAWQRTIKVYANQDSEPAIFLLKGVQSGPRHLTVDFYHKNRMLASVPFACEVQWGGSTSAVQVDVMRDLIADWGSVAPPSPADLELRIVRAGKSLQFTLHSAKPSVGYHWMKVGESTLEMDDPARWLTDWLRRLNQLAAFQRGVFLIEEEADGKPVAPQETPAQIIEQIGISLWEELIPDKLKEEYWKRIRKLGQTGQEGKPVLVRSLLITSDEPWIPWEMLKPYRREDEDAESQRDPFLAESFQVCRWLAGRGASEQVALRSATIVAPTLDLENVEAEVKWVQQTLAQRQITLAAPLTKLAEVKQHLQKGEAHLFHFATHGAVNSKNVEQSQILLQDGRLTPADLSVDQLEAMRKTRPLIFLNTCNSGNLGFGLTGLGGWAEKFIKDGRASAFIGAQWEINDKLAAELADHFYQHLVAGKPLGEAFHLARQTLRTTYPGNPTWLAYALYGDPNSLLEAQKPT